MHSSSQLKMNCKCYSKKSVEQGYCSLLRNRKNGKNQFGNQVSHHIPQAQTASRCICNLCVLINCMSAFLNGLWHAHERDTQFCHTALLKSALLKFDAIPDYWWESGIWEEFPLCVTTLISCSLSPSIFPDVGVVNGIFTNQNLCLRNPTSY